jgi:hypothetical protein
LTRPASERKGLPESSSDFNQKIRSKNGSTCFEFYPVSDSNRLGQTRFGTQKGLPDFRLHPIPGSHITQNAAFTTTFSP